MVPYESISAKIYLASSNLKLDDVHALSYIVVHTSSHVLYPLHAVLLVRSFQNHFRVLEHQLELKRISVFIVYDVNNTSQWKSFCLYTRVRPCNMPAYI